MGNKTSKIKRKNTREDNQIEEEEGPQIYNLSSAPANKDHIEELLLPNIIGDGFMFETKYCILYPNNSFYRTEDPYKLILLSQFQPKVFNVTKNGIQAPVSTDLSKMTQISSKLTKLTFKHTKVHNPSSLCLTGQISQDISQKIYLKIDPKSQKILIRKIENFENGQFKKELVSTGTYSFFLSMSSIRLVQISVVTKDFRQNDPNAFKEHLVLERSGLGVAGRTGDERGSDPNSKKKQILFRFMSHGQLFGRGEGFGQDAIFKTKSSTKHVLGGSSKIKVIMEKRSSILKFKFFDLRQRKILKSFLLPVCDYMRFYLKEKDSSYVSPSEIDYIEGSQILIMKVRHHGDSYFLKVDLKKEVKESSFRPKYKNCCRYNPEFYSIPESFRAQRFIFSKFFVLDSQEGYQARLQERKNSGGKEDDAYETRFQVLNLGDDFEESDENRAQKPCSEAFSLTRPSQKFQILDQNIKNLKLYQILDSYYLNEARTIGLVLTESELILFNFEQQSVIQRLKWSYGLRFGKKTLLSSNFFITTENNKIKILEYHKSKFTFNQLADIDLKTYPSINSILTLLAFSANKKDPKSEGYESYTIVMKIQEKRTAEDEQQLRTGWMDTTRNSISVLKADQSGKILYTNSFTTKTDIETIRAAFLQNGLILIGQNHLELNPVTIIRDEGTRFQEVEIKVERKGARLPKQSVLNMFDPVGNRIALTTFRDNESKSLSQLVYKIKLDGDSSVKLEKIKEFNIDWHQELISENRVERLMRRIDKSYLLQKSGFYSYAFEDDFKLTQFKVYSCDGDLRYEFGLRFEDQNYLDDTFLKLIGEHHLLVLKNLDGVGEGFEAYLLDLKARNISYCCLSDNFDDPVRGNVNSELADGGNFWVKSSSRFVNLRLKLNSGTSCFNR